MTRFRLSLLTLALAVSACQGNVNVEEMPEVVDKTDSNPGPIQNRMPTMDDCDDDRVFTNDAPARLMTRYEFDNTVRDLLGVDATYAWEQLPTESAGGGFENNVDSHVVNPLQIRKLLEISELIAPGAVQNGAFSNGLADLLYRAFRRPPTTEEVNAYELLRTDAGEKWGAVRGDEMVIAAILQSPQFLYRLELIDDSNVPNELIKNSSFEMASRLSYMLWSTMPDEALFQAAEQNQLQTDEQIEAQVRRMLTATRSAVTVSHFYRQWLHLDSLDNTVKEASVFDGVTENLGHDWRASIDAFIQDVHSNGGTLSDLMTSPTVYVTPDMATLHGLPRPSGMARLELEHRAGLLTQPALMALLAYPNQGSPIHRGIFVREKMLCQKLGAPPDDMVIEPPDPDPNATTREKFAEHTANDACSGCHVLIDPIGFGFENYDGVGRYRVTENGLDVDASGELFASGDESADGNFDGAVELVARLADSSSLRDCIADQWTTFSLGRQATAADLCSVRDVRKRFAESDGSFEELLVAIAMSDAMRYRTVQGSE